MTPAALCPVGALFGMDAKRPEKRVRYQGLDLAVAFIGVFNLGGLTQTFMAVENPRHGQPRQPRFLLISSRRASPDFLPPRPRRSSGRARERGAQG